MADIKIKVCGITSVKDALAAVEAGADAIGLVFYSESRRFVKPDTAAEIVSSVGPFATTIGLFVNENREKVEYLYRETGVHVVQLHGDEETDYCDKLMMPYIKAIRMAPGLKPKQAMSDYPGAVGFIFDTWDAEQYGGTGKCFDWHRLAGLSGRKVILAGGLTPANVNEAVAITSPYAVDVSGGVEISPGCKDAALMKRFVKAARAPTNC